MILLIQIHFSTFFAQRAKDMAGKFGGKWWKKKKE
jgi:hypothetical protein